MSSDVWVTAVTKDECFKNTVWKMFTMLTAERVNVTEKQNTQRREALHYTSIKGLMLDVKTLCMHRSGSVSLQETTVDVMKQEGGVTAAKGPKLLRSHDKAFNWPDKLGHLRIYFTRVITEWHVWIIVRLKETFFGLFFCCSFSLHSEEFSGSSGPLPAVFAFVFWSTVRSSAVHE